MRGRGWRTAVTSRLSPGRGPVTAEERPAADAVTPGRTTGLREIDRPLVSRLMTAFQRSEEELRCYGQGSLWRDIRNRHGRLVSAIARLDVEEVGRALQQPDRNELFYGFEDLGRWSVEAYENAGQQQVYAQHCYDMLCQLGRALAVISQPNPEAPHRPHQPPPPAALADLIQRRLGFPIAPPAPYPNYYGLKTPTGVLGVRVINALYCAHRARQLTAGTTRPRVLEIGAGLGRLAHYAYLAGLTDYWIVDLPLTSMAHGHFLATALGANRVILDGEPDLPAGTDRIKIINSQRFFATQLPEFDLVINIDSLTELGRPLAEQYLRRVAPLTRRLFSINHEINEFTVSDVVTGTGTFRHSQRHPYWVRPGYIEELYWHQ